MTPKPPSAFDHRSLPVRRLKISGDRFEGDFRSRLSAGASSRRFVALVDLTEQLDLKVLARRLRGETMSKAARRAAVVAACETVASRQQTRLRPLLDRLVAEGAIGAVHSVAIVNRVVVEGTAEGLLELGASAEVAAVRPDWSSERADAGTIELPLDSGAPLGATFRSWAVDTLKADRLWRLGFDGTGVTVATIDTGAFEAHEQLRERRVPGERGWFDPVEGSTVASDRHGHGTGVLSQAVGGNPNGRVVGVAPGARWAAALGNWGNYYSRSRMTLAADWILRVARPDVVVNAWSHDEGECNDFDRPFIDAWKASGIFVVFPAGNAGPGPASGESPAQLWGIFPGGAAVFSVAALAESGGPHALSSRGPSRCGSPAFPTLAAPGAGLPIASSGGPKSYVRGQGTSLSAGLVGGAAALLLQAAPETDPETLERVLVRSAQDVAPPGRDDATGAGAVDLEAALALL
ncbi:MAG: S8 family serine peptidase, partial [Thermoplasmata archaeon]|nr:S8 family serine peptidase [Thermoplasmata archaeon]